MPDLTYAFTINTGAYSDGDTWEFKVYAFLKNIDLIEFTIPLILLGDLGITVLAGSEVGDRNPICN